MTESARAAAIADEALAILAGRDGDRTYGEELSLRSHSLQAADLATRAGLGPELTAAALLHDIAWTWDARTHDVTGADWVETRFGAMVADPIRRHVAAKRFLVATEPDYRARLTETSIATLAMQGGAMSDAEIIAFREAPGLDRVIALRRIDDEAKEPEAQTPPLDAYRDLLRDLAIAHLRSKVASR